MPGAPVGHNKHESVECATPKICCEQPLTSAMTINRTAIQFQQQTAPSTKNGSKASRTIIVFIGACHMIVFMDFGIVQVNE